MASSKMAERFRRDWIRFFKQLWRLGEDYQCEMDTDDDDDCVADAWDLWDAWRRSGRILVAEKDFGYVINMVFRQHLGSAHHPYPIPTYPHICSCMKRIDKRAGYPNYELDETLFHKDIETTYWTEKGSLWNEEGVSTESEKTVPTGKEEILPTGYETGVSTPAGEDGVSMKGGTPIGKEEGVPTEKDGIPIPDVPMRRDEINTGEAGAPIPDVPMRRDETNTGEDGAPIPDVPMRRDETNTGEDGAPIPDAPMRRDEINTGEAGAPIPDAPMKRDETNTGEDGAPTPYSSMRRDENNTGKDGIPISVAPLHSTDAPILIAPKKEKEGARVVPLETLGGGGGEENKKG